MSQRIPDAKDAFQRVEMIAQGGRGTGEQAAGAERAIYLTWPASRPLLPAADLFRKHVIRTVSAGRFRPVGN